jgi:hypothetical protein
MNNNKKGLQTKVITVYDDNTDQEFDVYVSYYVSDDYNNSLDEDLFQVVHFESNNDVDLPEWVNEIMVLESLIESHISDEIDEMDKWDNESEFDTNW